MTDIQAWIDQGRTLADQAADHVGRLAAGDDKWTMTVPPKDTDSDLRLVDLLDGRLPQALNALQAVLDMHYSTEWGDCAVCVSTPGGGDIFEEPFPCPTVRAIQDAIGDKR